MPIASTPYTHCSMAPMTHEYCPGIIEEGDRKNEPRVSTVLVLYDTFELGNTAAEAQRTKPEREQTRRQHTKKREGRSKSKYAVGSSREKNSRHKLLLDNAFFGWELGAKLQRSKSPPSQTITPPSLPDYVAIDCYNHRSCCHIHLFAINLFNAVVKSYLWWVPYIMMWVAY
jgi:hypothetical protein